MRGARWASESRAKVGGISIPLRDSNHNRRHDCQKSGFEHNMTRNNRIGRPERDLGGRDASLGAEPTRRAWSVAFRLIRLSARAVATCWTREANTFHAEVPRLALCGACGALIHCIHYRGAGRRRRRQRQGRMNYESVKRGRGGGGGEERHLRSTSEICLFFPYLTSPSSFLRKTLQLCGFSFSLDRWDRFFARCVRATCLGPCLRVVFICLWLSSGGSHVIRVAPLAVRSA